MTRLRRAYTTSVVCGVLVTLCGVVFFLVGVMSAAGDRLAIGVVMVASGLTMWIAGAIGRKKPAESS